MAMPKNECLHKHLQWDGTITDSDTGDSIQYICEECCARLTARVYIEGFDNKELKDITKKFIQKK